MPRVEYTLSFENYLEMMRPGRKKPDYKMATISAFVGLFCIGAGYTYLRILPDTQPMIGMSLLAFGLLTSFLAMPLAFLSKPRDSRSDATTRQREYELFASDKRAIEFDEAAWRVFWFDGEDVRPWSCLRSIHDQKTLLVLSTQTTYYWLPKAALEGAGQLEPIKGLAERALNSRELLFTVPLRPSPFVYAVAMYSHNWPRHYKTILLWYSLGILLFYWVFLSGWDAETSHSPWLLCLAPLLFLFCEGLYYLRNYYVANWSEAAQEAEIMSDCVSYKTATVHMITTYRKLLKVREVPGAFLLYFQSAIFHIIPKKGLSRERLDQFRKLISVDRQTY